MYKPSSSSYDVTITGTFTVNKFTNFIGMAVTDIAPCTLTPQPSPLIYDLSGRRITDTEGIKGIYIVNGKKVLVK